MIASFHISSKRKLSLIDGPVSMAGKDLCVLYGCAERGTGWTIAKPAAYPALALPHGGTLAAYICTASKL